MFNIITQEDVWRYCQMEAGKIVSDVDDAEELSQEDLQQIQLQEKERGTWSEKEKRQYKKVLRQTLRKDRYFLMSNYSRHLIRGHYCILRSSRQVSHTITASASHNDGGGGGSGGDSSDDGGSDPQPEPHKVALTRRGQGAVVVSIKQNSRMEESSGTHCVKCGTVEFFACFFTAKEEAA